MSTNVRKILRKASIRQAFSLADIAYRVAGFEQTAYIKKEKGKYCVKSEKNPDWNGGCYDTKEEAKKRLGEIEMFKHMGKDLSLKD